MTVLHASTILFRSSTAFVSYLSRLPKSYSDHILLFALSTNTQSESELSSLVSNLRAFSSQTVGCLSAPLPSAVSNEVFTCCSLAVLDKSVSTVFRSTIPGRAEPQVGRWHAFRKRDDVPPPGTHSVGLKEDVDWEDVWRRDVGGNQLPENLANISPEDVRSVIYLSDGAPEGLSNSLNGFPNATKMGLLSSSTPFITGRPVTLLTSRDIYSSGAVGVALTGPAKSSPLARVEFPGLQAITPELRVTNLDGNLVHELDNANASRLLLNAIRNSGISDGLTKEEDYYLGTMKGGKLWQVYRIMSGDPSRGTMSLESSSAPPKGTPVKIYHLSKSARTDRLARNESSDLPTLSFLATPQHTDLPSEEEPVRRDPRQAHEEEIVVLPNKFIAASEHGWILSRSAKETENGHVEESWKCTVQGGRASLEWR